jgi:hypothetical protein
VGASLNSSCVKLPGVPVVTVAKLEGGQGEINQIAVLETIKDVQVVWRRGGS